MKLSKRLRKHRFNLDIDTYAFIPPKTETELSTYWITLPLDFTGKLEMFVGEKHIQAAITGIYNLSVPEKFQQFKTFVDTIGEEALKREFKEALWSGYLLDGQLRSIMENNFREAEEKEYLIEDF